MLTAVLLTVVCFEIFTDTDIHSFVQDTHHPDVKEAGCAIAAELAGMGFRPDMFISLGKEYKDKVIRKLESLQGLPMFAHEMVYTSLLMNLQGDHACYVQKTPGFQKELFKTEVKAGKDTNLFTKMWTNFKSRYERRFSPDQKNVVWDDKESAMYPQWQCDEVQKEVIVHVIC
jgi:hypothetical protein